jgi:hypothetical protein
MTGIFAVISLLTIFRLLKYENENYEQFRLIFNSKKYRQYIGVITVLIGYFVGLFEVSYQADHYVYGVNSAITLPILYHLIFSAFLFYFLCKSKNIFGIQLASIIGVINIILFAFCFSNYAFYEHEQYISSGIHQRIGFYLHYISLVITIYFGYQIYKMNKENIIFNLFKKEIFVWMTAFIVIFIASNELMLLGLVITNSPVTMQEVQTNDLFREFKTDQSYIRSQITYDFIETVKTQITKTGFPILWGVLAFVFLIVGIKKQNKTLRIVALTLLGITILKLFLFDIRNVSETGKIIAFILLGVLILIISFVYQKIKVLVLDDNKPKEINETE